MLYQIYEYLYKLDHIKRSSGIKFQFSVGKFVNRQRFTIYECRLLTPYMHSHLQCMCKEYPHKYPVVCCPNSWTSFCKYHSGKGCKGLPKPTIYKGVTTWKNGKIKIDFPKGAKFSQLKHAHLKIDIKDNTGKIIGQELIDLNKQHYTMVGPTMHLNTHFLGHSDQSWIDT